MPTFYDFPMAPSPRRARIVLLEKKIAFDTVVINLMEQEQLGDAYRKINPRCTIPTLALDDGTILDDNASILAWADAEYPDPPLLGSTPIERAKVAGWISRTESEGLMAIAEVLRNSSKRMQGRALPGPDGYEQIPELAERGKKRLAVFWKALNEHLKGREYLAGEQFSAADIVGLVTVDFSKVVRQQPSDEHAELWRWRRALDTRPSVNG
ncbi:MAG: glutathione S-transferase family protein [Pseudomonadota bacterium]